MIFTRSIKPYASKSQFIKAGEKVKISNVWWGEEKLGGGGYLWRWLLIILSKKVSVTYSKTAIPANLCWRSWDIWRGQKALHCPLLTNLEPSYLLQRPWCHLSCRHETSLMSMLPFPPGAGAAAWTGGEKLWTSHEKEWFLLFLRTAPWEARKKKRGTGKHSHIPI